MAERVLLIDDDQEFLEILAERLTIRGMEVATASSAKEACEMVLKATYDVAILDLHMPQVDGLQAIDQLKTICPGLPIILLTAHATVAKGVEAMKLGAVDVLEKPADIRALIEKIRTVAIGQTEIVSRPTTAHGAAIQPGAVARVFTFLRDLFGNKS